MRLARPLIWLLRLWWLALPFAAGPSFAAALDGADGPLQTTASVGLWTAWAVGVLATLVPRPWSLTTIRLLAPAALTAAVAAAAGGHASAVGLGAAALSTGAALAPEVGWLCANGAAYGDERRHLLRVPGPLLLGPLPLACALVVAGVAGGPLLLAAEQWIAGAAATAAGVPVAVLLARALHGLALRWIVFVPAGLVLHDHLALTDPLLFQRGTVLSFGPAPADTDALDLTKGAPGLALELVLRDDADLPLAKPMQRLPEMTRARRILVTPTRPGAVLADARRRRLPVG